MLLLTAVSAGAQMIPDNVGQSSKNLPPALVNVRFDPQLNAQIPADASFVDEMGAPVTLGQYFGKRPVVLVFAYYTCPMLCSQVEQAVVGTLKMLSFNPGTDYDVVFVSFDTSDTPDAALKKKHEALREVCAAHDGRWLAFPDRDARIDRRGDEGGEFQLQLRRKEQDVRARERHPAADAGWKNFTVLFRRGISGEQRTAGLGGRVGGENRDAGRSPAAVLLPV